MLSRGVRSLFSRVPVVRPWQLARAMATSKGIELYEKKIVAALRERGGKTNLGTLSVSIVESPPGGGRFIDFLSARPAQFVIGSPEVHGLRMVSLVDAALTEDSMTTTTEQNIKKPVDGATSTGDDDAATYERKIVAALKGDPKLGGWVNGKISKVGLGKLRQLCGPPPAGSGKFLKFFRDRPALFEVAKGGRAISLVDANHRQDSMKKTKKKSKSATYADKIVAALKKDPELGGWVNGRLNEQGVSKLREVCGPPPAGSGKFIKFLTARPALFRLKKGKKGKLGISLVNPTAEETAMATSNIEKPVDGATSAGDDDATTYERKIVAALKKDPELGGWVNGKISNLNGLVKLRQLCGPPPAGKGKFLKFFRDRPALFEVAEGENGQYAVTLVDVAGGQDLPATTTTTSDIEKPVEGETTSTSSSAILLVDSAQKLAKVRLSDPAFNGTPPDSPVSGLDAGVSASSDARAIVSIDCEFTQKRQDPTSVDSWNPEDIVDELCLIQVATSEGTYIFDCRRLTPHTVCDVLRPLLASSDIIKLFHDIHKDAHCLHFHGGIDSISCVFDTQLAAEHLFGKGMLVSLSDLLQGLCLPEHSSKRLMSREFALDPRSFWKRRPLSDDQIDYAAQDVKLLLEAGPMLMARLGREGVDAVIAASRTRAEARMHNAELHRSVCFDPSRNDALASAELLSSTHRDTHKMRPITVESEASDFVSLLPPDLQTKFHDGEHGERIDMNQLRDIVLDIGRRPICYTVSATRSMLSDSDEREVTRADIEFVTSKIGGFGSDNRAAMDGKLHRISAIHDRDGRQVTGLTMRCGRYVQGNADMILDVLATDKSILILGEPGSGKTTIVREVTRMLAEKKAVVVIDTSNEIAGDGNVPHACIGDARRMMVPSLGAQSEVMIECVQNHTPQVMIVDEIGRPKEVAAVRTVKQRGVRVVGSAHGSLESLIRNQDLNGLVGGSVSVTIGDEMARSRNARMGGMVSKVQTQRQGDATFDVVVEIKSGMPNEWRVILDAASAVDSILSGKQYKAQVRTRDPLTGQLAIKLINI